MGMPPDMIEAEARFYQQLQCRFKVGKSVSNLWKRSRGYVQGASYSIEAALALMSVWTRAVEGETRAETGGFLNDCNILSHGEGHEQVTRAAM